MKKLHSLTFYTNMPTPYQIDFFNALKEYFDLTVVYFSIREKDRFWNVSYLESGYNVIVLKDSLIARIVQKYVPSFHFSMQIVKVLFQSQARFVIVNGTYWSPNVLLSLSICWMRSKKVFYWTEPILPVSNKIAFWGKYLVLFPIRFFTSAILAIGKQTISSFKHYGYKKRMHNIPYNIDISLFSKASLDSFKLNDLMNTFKKGNKVILITSCSLIARKGVDTLIKAFLNVYQSNARLLILGDGPERQALEKLAAPAGEHIVFLGFVEKELMPYYFSIADIFTFASRYDGWALVINEAIAADLAIICSDKVGAATDKLRDKHNALIFPVDDVVALQTAMHNLISDESLRSRLVANSQDLKKEVSSEFNAYQIYGLCNEFK